MLIRRALVSLAVLASSLVAPVVHGQTWSPPSTVASSASPMREPAVGVNASGVTCATWVVGGRVQARVRARGLWGPVGVLSPAGVTATEPATSVAANGDVVVAWVETAPAGQSLKAMYQRAGRWGTTSTIAGPVLRVSSPRVRFNGANVAVLVWSQGGSDGSCAVWGVSGTVTTGWGAVTNVSRTTGCWGWVRLATAGTGEALVAFSNTRPATGGGHAIWVSSRNASTGAWGAPVSVAPATYRSGEPSVALADNGLAVVTWADAYGPNWSRRAPDGTWTVPAPVDDQGLNSYNGRTEVAMDAAGNAVVALGTFDMSFTYQPVTAAKLGAYSNRWTPATLVTAPASTINSFQIAASPAGTFVLGWCDGEMDMSGRTVGAGVSTLAPGSGWRRQFFGSGDDRVAAAAAAGNGVVLWNVQAVPSVVRISTAPIR